MRLYRQISLLSGNLHPFKAKMQLQFEPIFQSVRHNVLYVYSLYSVLPVVWNVENIGQNHQDHIKAKY